MLPADEFWIVNWSTNCDGMCDRIDAEWSRITGQTIDAALGKGWLAAIHDDDREQVKAELNRARQSIRPFKIITRLRRADGQFRWAMAVASPKRDYRGEFIGFTGSTIDFHERARAEQELAETRQRLEAIMNAAPVGLSYSSGPDCAHVTGNRTLCSQFEIDAAENISASSPNPADVGRRVRFFELGRELTDAELPLQRAVRERREVAPVEFDVHLPSGRRWIAEASAAPIVAPDGRLFGGVAVTIDVTQRKKENEALRKSEERYRRLFETSRDGIVAVNLDGQILEANPAYQEMLGYEFEELKRLTYRDLTPQIWHEMEAKIVQEQILPFGESAEYEKEYIRKDGTVFPISLRTWTVMDEDGRIVGMRAFVRDISERAKAEAALRESEERFRALVAASSDVVYRMNPDWTEMRHLVGRDFIEDTEEASESWLEKYILPEDQPHVMAVIREAIRTKSLFELEHRVLRVDGEVGWTHSRAIPILDDSGEIKEWFGMASDITARKQADEKLRDSDRRKEEFLAMLAHELRNPLAPIKNGLDVMRAGDVDATKMTRMREIMGRQVDHLIRLVDDLLDISRINQGRIELRKASVDLSDMIHDAVAACRGIMSARDHKLTVLLPSDPVLLEADPIRLVQILTNLLNNAAKYTEVGGNIEISAGADGDCAVVRVRDNGIGIQPEMIQRIFELFAQVDCKFRHGGLGIGLALARNLVELHGGRIEALSDGVGRGAEFVVTLPRTTAQSSTAA